MRYPEPITSPTQFKSRIPVPPSLLFPSMTVMFEDFDETKRY